MDLRSLPSIEVSTVTASRRMSEPALASAAACIIAGCQPWRVQ